MNVMLPIMRVKQKWLILANKIWIGMRTSWKLFVNKDICNRKKKRKKTVWDLGFAMKAETWWVESLPNQGFRGEEWRMGPASTLAEQLHCLYIFFSSRHLLPNQAEHQMYRKQLNKECTCECRSSMAMKPVIQSGKEEASL